jgi:hypothetical protein
MRKKMSIMFTHKYIQAVTPRNSKPKKKSAQFIFKSCNIFKTQIHDILPTRKFLALHCLYKSWICFSYRIMILYALFLNLESFDCQNIIEASTLAGLYQLGSLSKLTTKRRIVLKRKRKAYKYIGNHFWPLSLGRRLKETNSSKTSTKISSMNLVKKYIKNLS